MSAPKVCKKCQTYLLDHRDLILFHKGWKYCPSCGWCCDKEGYNLVSKKEEKQDGKEVQQKSSESNFSKDAKENENGRTEINGPQEGSSGTKETNAQADEKENEQKGLQVKEAGMISLQEILKGKDFNSLPEEHQANLMILLERISKIRTAFAKPMTVTSGYRSMAEHLEIYKKKGITDQSKIPMKSRHLSGQAIDIYDPNKILQSWVLNNVKVLEEVGLWCEDFSATPNWVHFQIVPPASGKRFFKP